jgi:hypothetical protein
MRKEKIKDSTLCLWFRFCDNSVKRCYMALYQEPPEHEVSLPGMLVFMLAFSLVKHGL